MRVPVSWLREYVDLPADVTPRGLAAKLISVGLEVETVDEVGAELAGPIVVGRVAAIEELTGFKKPIRYCQVDVGTANGSGERQNIICGAVNFAVGDLVVVSLPGAVLAGGFAIGSRQTYGRLSEGMICSATELGLWEDHAGIVVLPEGFADPGTDAFDLLGLRDDVLDIAVTPDRGYALSMRGVARDAAVLYGAAFTDPAEVKPPATEGEGYPAAIADLDACDRFVLRDISGFDTDAPTPLWMKRRLALAGMRSVSLAVDVTNYVMWETGQPLHAFDRAKLSGGIVVRRARAGERLETLDHVDRALDPDDILITDDSGPISMAGTMGGLNSEIDDASTDLVVEAAHFSESGTARMSRRHNLHSEASRRFERGVDRRLPPYASARAVELLLLLGGGRMGGLTDVDPEVLAPPPIVVAEDHAAKVAGVDYPAGTSSTWLRAIGCTVEELPGVLSVVPPPWRTDISDPNDLAEEVIRFEGYENIPAIPPRAPAGRGLTRTQRLRRAVGRGLAGAGYSEVLSFPFVGERDLDGLHLPEDDPRRASLALANPMSDGEPLLRTTLLPGLLKTLARNAGRGSTSVSLFEAGLVYLPRDGAPARAPAPAVDRAPGADELTALAAAIPDQPYRVGAVLAGDREPAGWWGGGRQANWADAVEAAHEVARAAGVALRVAQAQAVPWHPGRCAALSVPGPDGEVVVGHAGELHPRVVKAYGLPERSVAMEVGLDLIEAAIAPADAPFISTYPVATQDVALVVEESVPAGAVEAALRSGAGELLEAVRLFDVYTGAQVGEGRKSLAYTLRLRAGDRTLTAEEATAARDAAVASAGELTGARLRG
ncbi:phenylalanyl-tRNA synthetase beta subunit [Murinocardiopsis flavida]|uniref:Phenylalanine--tRNA ligase beta subunit n=1 Tax=Murinocardiopsis flavida TaxID=645275 RepID=A0A2P8DK93_9ACTN|nr:phenylalanine--tRNA ligase subunit beta [Murinocardiopsis flavida]PSK97634.1 phenylalanyl-tRNA synthetase beta subunit [Murinocardiopsis flavida]